MKLVMSKKILIGLAAAATFASTTLAAPAQLKFVNTNAWGQSDSTRGGGPFEATPINQGAVQGLGTNGASAGNYITFCVERNEHIGNGATYNAKVNTVADKGGLGGGNPDPLDARTAFLYTAFLKGTLADKLASAGLSSFIVGDGVSGSALQDAIWAIENELDAEGGREGIRSQIGKDMYDLASAAVMQGGEWYGKGIGSVRILNLTDPNTGDTKQDQLILIPLPTSAMLALAGLLGVAYISRKRSVLGV